jgi:hypothetical protein
MVSQIRTSDKHSVPTESKGAETRQQQPNGSSQQHKQQFSTANIKSMQQQVQGRGQIGTIALQRGARAQGQGPRFTGTERYQCTKAQKVRIF